MSNLASSIQEPLNNLVDILSTAFTATQASTPPLVSTTQPD